MPTPLTAEEITDCLDLLAAAELHAIEESKARLVELESLRAAVGRMEAANAAFLSTAAKDLEPKPGLIRRRSRSYGFQMPA